MIVVVDMILLHHSVYCFFAMAIENIPICLNSIFPFFNYVKNCNRYHFIFRIQCAGKSIKKFFYV